MSDKAEQKLRACPFCGFPPDVWEEFGNDHRAGCTNGDCPGSFGDFGIDLMIWNTRPTEDKLVEALEYVLKHGLLKGGDKARQALAEVKS